MPSTQPATTRGALSSVRVATKAALRAADRLNVSSKVLARIVGLSEASVSRLRAGTYTFSPDDKAFELALLLVRLYRSLDAIVGGDDEAAAAWMVTDNRAFGATPLALVQTVAGLMHVVHYLDARRALA